MLPNLEGKVADNEIENPLKINYLMLKKSALVLRALNHKLRQQIIQIIANKEKIIVTDLYVKLRMEQSIVSQHLAILRKANILKTERNGKFIYYMINYNKVETIKEVIKNLLS